MEDIGKIVVAQTFLYSLAFLTIALTVAIVLDLFKVSSLPTGIRNYVYGTFFVGILALMLSYGQDIIKTPGQIRAEVDQKIVDTTDQNISLAEQRTSVVERSNLPGGSPPPVSPTGSQTSPGDVTLYIQAATSNQKLGSTGFVGALRTIGVKTSGVEIVGPARSPSKPEVRYFNSADETAADTIAKLAVANGLSGTVAKPISTYKAKTGVLELWYPR